MNNGKDHSLRVKEFYAKAKNYLKLNPHLEKTGFMREIILPSSKKDILSIQIWGKDEIDVIQRLPETKRRQFIKEKFEKDVACVIFPKGISSLPEIDKEARKVKVALFNSALSQEKCSTEIKNFFSDFNPNKTLVSGGLLRIFGLGVLIIGDSGVGKSESALELISRGHDFISDDVTVIEKTSKGILMGKTPELSRFFMEIRGLGIINIKQIFGPKAICSQTEINLVINLKRWQKGKEYDRLGLKFPKEYKILEVKIPQLCIPVAPGRNIATLIEIASKVHMLRLKGYHAAKDIVQKLDKALSQD